MLISKVVIQCTLYEQIEQYIPVPQATILMREHQAFQHPILSRGDACPIPRAAVLMSIA